MKILVTGAAGFIGGNLVETLKSKGIEVIGVDNFSNYYSASMKRAHLEASGLVTSIQELDICNDAALQELFSDFRPTHVVHLAAQGGVRASKTDPIPYLQTNQTGFLNVLNAAERVGVSKFLYASSSSVYGEGLQAPFKESETLSAPKSLYALSKLSNELIAKHLPLRDTQRIGFRFFTVYGPWGRPDMAVFRLLASASLKEKFKLTASTDVMRDFTYVNDVSNLIDCALKSDISLIAPEIYNLAGGSPFTLSQLFEIIRDLGIKVQVEEASIDPLDVKMTHGSVLKLEKSHLLVPTTDLRDGITQTWNWMNKIEINQLRAWFEYSS
jgi:UDP-glucuronate 4-epimerase